MDQTTLLTTEQVAERLGKSVATVNRLAVRDRLPAAVQLNGVRGARLFDADVVATYEREQQSEAS